MNKAIILKNRPLGVPKDEDFQLIEEEMPTPKQGEILLKTRYVSVDPYLRGRMRDEKSYIEPFEIGKPIDSGIIAEVVDSKNQHFKKGDFVNGMLKWKEYQISPGNGLNKVNPEIAPLTAYLSVLGLTGLTAYLGLEKFGNLKKGETLLVSGAAGAVGSTVCQIGKIMGCKVVGIAGSDEKIEYIQEKYDLDGTINYKTEGDLGKAITETCKDGVDVYFDNVGGEMLDAALVNMNRYGRVINCGAISLYHEKKQPQGPRVESILIKNSLSMHGFIVRDFVKDFGPAQKQLATWLQQDKLDYMETIVEGFENIPQAFMGLFEGKNKGKMIVKV